MIHLITSLDTSVLQFLYEYRTMLMTLIFIDISELGRYEILMPLSAAVGMVLYLYRRIADIAGLAIAVFGSAAAVMALKVFVNRPRPALIPFQAYPEGASYSFPSAHAALSVAFYGFIMYLLLQSAPSAFRRFIIACMPIVMLLVSFSRLYLGVHYLSDVLAGLCIGALFLAIAIQARLHLLKR